MHDVRYQPELLLAESKWLRALAVHLVHDGNRADDLVQETYLAAIEHPPRQLESLRFWLARVLERFALRERARERQRRCWERAAARGELVESTGAIAERLAIQRHVVDALLALEEPYRSTLVLRFFDDLTPRLIAAREGLPLGTVRTRLRHGLTLLRDRLDREHHGNRLAWVMPLAALARHGTMATSSTAAAVLTGASIMTVKSALGLFAATLVVAASIAWLALTEREQHPAQRARPAVTRGDASPPELLAQPPAITDEPQRDVVGAASEGSFTSATADPMAPSKSVPTIAIAGVLLDAASHPLAAVRVGCEHATSVSGNDGSFALQLPGQGATITIHCLDVRFTTVLAPHVDPFEAMTVRPRYVVVAARRLALRGMVVDEHDQAVAGATVRIHPPLDMRASFAGILDWSSSAEWRTTSDATGTFALLDAPAIEATAIEAWQTGVGRGSIPLPAQDDFALRIVLRRSAPDADRLELQGRVVTLAGNPVAGAMVCLDETRVRADGDGRFELTVARRSAKPRQLLAFTRGALPALHVPDRDADGNEAWPLFLELVLGAKPKSIAGRVLGHDGEAIAGATVWLLDPSYLGKGEDDRPVTMENQIAAEPGEFTQVRTDGSGRFALTGLTERGYTVCAMDPNTLQSATVKATATDQTDVVIRFPRSGLHERVAGRVVDRRAQPLAGLDVWLANDGCQIVSSRGTVWGSGGARRRGGQTDASGAFVLTQVPRAGVKIVVESERILPVAIDDDDHDVTITATLKCHVQFEVTDGADEGAFVTLLDVSGNQELFYIFGGGSTWIVNRAQLTGGRSVAISAPDSAVIAVLHDTTGRELRRTPITLDPNGLTTVRL